jgi:hypothetical protein
MNQILKYLFHKLMADMLKLAISQKNILWVVKTKASIKFINLKEDLI